ncbi:MAG TPA: AraC family transcriptional regulator [Candidatus Corynebacterium avicola]|uniref:HTH-type transcriptional regulator RipA n=1 Tax=Candidatus Corynebacterium avicola TaxID=2838527 RepID=A0A9D1RQK0_9CORY|nr:AraC family transcriptional regulator [Candidatus Corynebacterium avicola]
MAAIITGGEENPPTTWESHSHPAPELVWVRRGAMTTFAEGRIFTVPEGRGIWIPAHTEHSGTVTAGVTLYGTLFAPDAVSAGGFTPPGRTTVVTMDPVLESLLTYLGRDTLTPDARSRAESVVFDVLEPVGDELDLPIPDDHRIAPIVSALLEDPGHQHGLDRWARELDLSERTITRAFRSNTGMSFGTWRQTLRIQRSRAMLSEGLSVSDVAQRCGYAQTSTFIDVFRRQTGATPGVRVRNP